MELITGHTGVAHIRSEDDAVLNQACYGKGHFVLSTASFPEEHTDHGITIYPGDALMDGRLIRIRSGESETFDLYPPGTGLVAGDIIYIEYKKQNGIESAELKIARGSASSGEVVLPDIADSRITPISTSATFPLFSVIYSGTKVQSVNHLFDIGSPKECTVSITANSGGTTNSNTVKAKVIEIADGLTLIAASGDLGTFKVSADTVTAELTIVDGLKTGLIPIYTDFRLMPSLDSDPGPTGVGPDEPSAFLYMAPSYENGESLNNGSKFTSSLLKLGLDTASRIPFFGIRYKFFALAW